MSDLAISSLGPTAEVCRSYRAGAATTRHAPGWFFSFDQHLDLSHAGDALSRVTYTDAANVAHDFYRPTGSSAWLAPNGLVATLSQNPDGTWKLLFDQGQDYLTFSSSGQLLSETAANGLATSYAWSANSLTITAANGQQIVVALSSGAVTGASYATSAGTRTVAYAGSGSAWSVTYNAADTGANGTARTVAYTYASGLLTGATQQAWPQSGSSATLAIIYNASNKLIEVRYPDYDAAAQARRPRDDQLRHLDAGHGEPLRHRRRRGQPADGPERLHLGGEQRRGAEPDHERDRGQRHRRRDHDLRVRRRPAGRRRDNDERRGYRRARPRPRSTAT